MHQLLSLDGTRVTLNSIKCCWAATRGKTGKTTVLPYLDFAE